MNVAVTFFTNQFATSKTEQSITLADLARRIQTTTAPTKAGLPWLKLARFGWQRTVPKNSLRHDANLLAITGLEADYDGEQIAFDQAVETLGAAGILAIVYTSPSHCPAAPRWRVLAPFAAEYPPDHRDRLLARLNGLLGGIIAPESWTRSQSYYFGSVNRNPSHRVVLLDGTPINRMVELDAIAIGKPQATTGAVDEGLPPPPFPPPADISDKRVAALIAQLLDNVRRAVDGQKHYTLLRNGRAIGGYLHLTSWTDEQAIDALVEALPDSVKDKVLARKTAAWAIAKGKEKTQTPPDRPYEGRRAAA